MKRGLQLVVDGGEPEAIRAILEVEVGVREHADNRAAKVFEGIDIGRAAIARGIAADIGLGYRDQRDQRIGVAAARGLNQQGVATPCSGQRGHGEGSLRPTMAHIGQKPKKPVTIATTPAPAIR